MEEKNKVTKDVNAEAKEEVTKEEVAKEEMANGDVTKEEGKASNSKWMTYGLIAVGGVLVLFALFNLIKIGFGYKKEANFYDNLENKFVSSTKKPGKTDSKKEEDPPKPWYELFEIDLEGVQELNSDVCGWISFENEDISYPILHADNNDTYLRTGLDGNYLNAGSIFLEAVNHTDFSDSHTIIYGHNMKDKSMFGKLQNYRKENYYAEHQYFQIFTADKIYRYQIFSYRDVLETDGLYYIFNNGDSGYDSMLSQMYRGSYVDSGVDASSDDKIITLSTCAAEGERLVVHAVRVEEHERN